MILEENGTKANERRVGVENKGGIGTGEGYDEEGCREECCLEEVESINGSLGKGGWKR